jgi:hypothetical protein
MARFSVRALLALVAIVALGLAAMSNGSELAEDLTLAFTLLALSIATVGAMVRTSPAAAWRGFATFGWVYFLLFQFARFDHQPTTFYDFVLPTQPLLDAAMPRLHPAPVRPQEPMFLAQHPFYRPTDDFQFGIQGSSSLIFQDAEQQHKYDEFKKKMTEYMNQISGRGYRVEYASVIGHYCLTILLALLGSTVGESLAGRRGDPPRASS